MWRVGIRSCWNVGIGNRPRSVRPSPPLVAREFPCCSHHWLVSSRCPRETNHFAIHASRRHRVLAHRIPGTCPHQRCSCGSRGVAWPFAHRRSLNRTCAASRRTRCTVAIRSDSSGCSDRCPSSPSVVARKRPTSSVDPNWKVEAQEFHPSYLET